MQKSRATELEAQCDERTRIKLQKQIATGIKRQGRYTSSYLVILLPSSLFIDEVMRCQFFILIKINKFFSERYEDVKYIQVKRKE